MSSLLGSFWFVPRQIPQLYSSLFVSQSCSLGNPASIGLCCTSIAGGSHGRKLGSPREEGLEVLDIGWKPINSWVEMATTYEILQDIARYLLNSPTEICRFLGKHISSQDDYPTEICDLQWIAALLEAHQYLATLCFIVLLGGKPLKHFTTIEQYAATV